MTDAIERAIPIGTSGYAYDDWQGAFYPPHVPKHKRLDYYASVFPALEINATYYGTPKPASAKRAVAEAAGRLAFAVKAPGDTTHRGRTDTPIVRPFMDYLEPFREAGVLSAALFQFPNAMHNDAEGRALMRQAAAAYRGLPMVVELRHASWDTPEADAFLRDLALSRAAIDQPALRGLSQSCRVSLTGPIAYFRFHGRNAAAWYGGGREGERESGDGRYRYRYNEDELLDWIPVVRKAASKSSTTNVFFNNHPDGNATSDGLMFAEMLGSPLAAPYSADFFR